MLLRAADGPDRLRSQRFDCADELLGGGLFAGQVRNSRTGRTLKGSSDKCPGHVFHVVITNATGVADGIRFASRHRSAGQRWAGGQADLPFRSIDDMRSNGNGCNSKVTPVLPITFT